MALITSGVNLGSNAPADILGRIVHGEDIQPAEVGAAIGRKVARRNAARRRVR
jgi:hypothetical protein